MFILLAPTFAVILAIVSVGFAIKKLKYWSIVFLVACLILNWYSHSFAYQCFAGDIHKERDEEVIRLLNYNVWNRGVYMALHTNDVAEDLLKSLLDYNADILVVNELVYSENGLLIDTLNAIYPFSLYDSVKTDTKFSTQVFSKYPISNIKHLRYLNDEDEVTDSESWLMRVSLPHKDINLLACHLSSNKLTESSSDDIKKIYECLKKGYGKRKMEVDAFKDSLIACGDVPTIIAGDFNDIGGSYAVKTMSGNNLADAWWEGGFGYGHTFHGHDLFFRLDHILYSKEHFKLKGVKVLKDWKYSDHYPIVADLEVLCK